MRKWLGIIFMAGLLLWTAVAGAEAFVIQVDELDASRLKDNDYIARVLTGAAQYLRLECDLGETQESVSLSIARADTGKTVYQKKYSKTSGMFSTGDIYLKNTGSEPMTYRITLTAGDKVWQFPFRRELMYLQNNTACSYGIRLREAETPVTDGWAMATVVNLNDLAARGSLQTPLCASDRYVIGKVNITRSGDHLGVTLQPAKGLDLTIHRQQVYAVTQPDTLIGLREKDLKRQVHFAPGETISVSKDLGDSPYVILYVALEVSYDPNGLETFAPSPSNARQQWQWWQELDALSGLESIG